MQNQTKAIYNPIIHRQPSLSSWKVKVIAAQLHPSLRNPRVCSPPGYPVHGILPARLPEWVAISFSRGPSQPRDQTGVCCIAGRFFTIWATRGALILWSKINDMFGGTCRLFCLFKNNGFNILLKINHFLYKNQAIQKKTKKDTKNYHLISQPPEVVVQSVQFSQSVQSFSRVRLLATPQTAARQDSLSITNS